MDTQPTTSSNGHPQPSDNLPNVPDVWPGAWGAYKYSKQAVKRNWGTILGLLILQLFVSATPRILLHNAIGQLLGILIGIIANIALIKAYLASVRGQGLSFTNALQEGSQPMRALKYFVNSLVVGLGLIVATILFVVPVLFVFPRVLLTPYFLVDKNMGPLEAIRASWEATKGHAGKVWGAVGATIAMALLAITIIGIPFSLYFLFMYSASLGILYENVSRVQSPAVTQPPTVQ